MTVGHDCRCEVCGEIMECRIMHLPSGHPSPAKALREAHGHGRHAKQVIFRAQDWLEHTRELDVLPYRDAAIRRAQALLSEARNALEQFDNVMRMSAERFLWDDEEPSGGPQ
jgi:hypothetical protein